MRSLFLHSRFFYSIGALALLCLISYFVPAFFTLFVILLSLLLLFTLIDIAMLYSHVGIDAERHVDNQLSNGKVNQVKITIENKYKFKIYLTVYDELPMQLDERHFKINTSISPIAYKQIKYEIIPKQRGIYEFGFIIIMVESPLRLVQRRYQTGNEEAISVYPAFERLDKYHLNTLKHAINKSGSKKIRKIGISSEFEQIKDYSKGDDIRHINWKASAKKSQLMVNQYIEERAQQIYSVIDTGRSMEMPFGGMTLLDYSINSALAISQIVINNNDNAGLIYFNKRVEKILKPDRALGQLLKIQASLFNLKTDFYESNYERLYTEIKNKIGTRSLLLLFTNFEDMNSLKRQLPYLKALSKNNLLVVIFFNNSELHNLIQSPSESQLDYFYKSIAEKYSYQKKLMTKELNRQGIQTILTDPDQLTIDTINKYLNIKSKSMI